VVEREDAEGAVLGGQGETIIVEKTQLEALLMADDRSLRQAGGSRGVDVSKAISQHKTLAVLARRSRGRLPRNRVVNAASQNKK